MKQLEDLKNSSGNSQIESITIRGGHDKKGQPEEFDLTIKPGEVVCIVGPTGSGKSRFLADIELDGTQADTPTGRSILINGVVPDPAQRFSIEHKLRGTAFAEYELCCGIVFFLRKQDRFSTNCCRSKSR